MDPTPQLGPVPAPVDLRLMLRHHLLRRCGEALAAGAARRESGMRDASAHSTWAAKVRAAAREILGLVGLGNHPLNVRGLARHERRHHVMENLIFESVDGWQVNATLFRPHGRGPFPAVVVPCGHSSKADASHQLPPQVFARAGYAAITFDPPAQGGEKNAGNDHFHDGPRCDAVGQVSQRYFVADALRAMDYLTGRADIDVAAGFAMTGVSGGGTTTMWAALADDRIRVAAPVCCAAPLNEHPLGNGYATCPEPIPMDSIARGLDHADLMGALAPRPQMYMAGLRDEVFTAALSRGIVAELQRAYAAAGVRGHFDFYLEDCGHAYTVTMARRLVAFLDAHFLGRPGREHDPAFDEPPAMEQGEAMLCHPDPEPNMRTISLARAQLLRTVRPRLDGRADAARAVRALAPGVEAASVTRATRGPRVPCIASDVEEVLLEHEIDILLPATVLWPRRAEPWPAVVMFDDRGRWTDLRQGRWLAGVSRHLDRAAEAAPVVLSVDLRGWGDSALAATPFDLVGWSAPDRWPSYVASALGDGLLAQRVRDGVAACRWLAGQPGIDARRIVIAGHGLGGLVALLAAAMVEYVAGVVCMDCPWSIEDVVGEAGYTWDCGVFLPRILEHLDIQPLADAVAPVLMIRPRDAAGRVLRDEPDAAAVEWVWKRMGI